MIYMQEEGDRGIPSNEVRQAPEVAIDLTGENPWRIPAAASPENIPADLREKFSQIIGTLRNSPEAAQPFLKPYIRAFESYAEAPNLVVPFIIDNDLYKMNRPRSPYERDVIPSGFDHGA
jgi:hypothetical protein